MFGSKSSRIPPLALSFVVMVFSTLGVSVFASTWINNQNAASVIGQGTYGTAVGTAGPSGLYQPSAVRFDETSGKLFVTDCANNRVLRFTNAQAFTTVRPQKLLSVRATLTSQQAVPASRRSAVRARSLSTVPDIFGLRTRRTAVFSGGTVPRPWRVVLLRVPSWDSQTTQQTPQVRAP